MARKTKSTFKMAGYTYPGTSPVKGAKKMMKQQAIAAKRDSFMDELKALGEDEYASSNIDELGSTKVAGTMDISALPKKGSPAKSAAEELGKGFWSGLGDHASEAVVDAAVSGIVGLGVDAMKKKDRKIAQSEVPAMNVEFAKNKKRLI